MEYSYNYTSIKNNCLKLKNEVGMAVLKSKQTRVVYRDNQHIRSVHPYACFFRLVRLCDTIRYYYSIYYVILLLLLLLYYYYYYVIYIILYTM